MKKLSKKEAKQAIVDAIDAGRVDLLNADYTFVMEFAHPQAAEMLSGPKADPREKEFDYLESDILAPYKPTDSDLAKWAHDGGVHFRWGLKGFGFGEADIVFRDGKWVATTEGLGREFLIKILTRWAKQMKIK